MHDSSTHSVNTPSNELELVTPSNELELVTPANELELVIHFNLTLELEMGFSTYVDVTCTDRSYIQ